MAPSPRIPADPGAPAFPDAATLEAIEAIPEPALIYLPGGRIAAVNAAAARLSDRPVIGMGLRELLETYGVRRANGRPVIASDLPCARALRGEHVAHGERLEGTLPDGSALRIVVESRPIVLDGKVVGALSVWHDFDAYLRELDGRTE